MSLKVSSRFAGGNAADIDIIPNGTLPEVHFAADPCNGPEALWFHFRLEETAPDPTIQTKVKLVWMYFDTVAGTCETPDCVPVCRLPGQAWTRLKQGEEARTPDGRRQLTWIIPHPAPSVELAFSFPYGPPDVDALLERSKDYWQAAPIGLSQEGRRLLRLYNAVGAVGSTQPGVYMLARQQAGATPGSWVLDGFLRHWAQVRKGAYVIWALPFADIDGVMRGHYGRHPQAQARPQDQASSLPSARHELGVIRQDLARWKARCRPILALDLQSPGACEREGVYAHLPPDPSGPLTADITKWCNVIQSELQSEFAATDFKRPAEAPAPGAPPDVTTFLRAELSVPTIRLNIPYSHAAGNVLTTKSYREIGRRLALAILRRNG